MGIVSGLVSNWRLGGCIDYGEWLGDLAKFDGAVTAFIINMTEFELLVSAG